MDKLISTYQTQLKGLEKQQESDLEKVSYEPSIDFLS